MSSNSPSAGRSGVSPATAGLLSAVLSVLLTVSGTLLTIKSGFSEDLLFPILLWILFASSGIVGLAALWILVDALREERRSLEHLREFESYVPRLIRFRKRADRFTIKSNGDAVLEIECEVESDGSAPVPWVAFPMIAEVPDDRLAWTSIVITKLSVDGRDYDADAAFIRKSRKVVEDVSYLSGRIVEDGVIRVPVSLESRRQKCEFAVELELRGAFSDIGREEMCYTDVSYVTDELSVTVRGDGNLKIGASPYAQHRVEASQLGMDLVDLPESQRQSANCRSARDVVWRSTDSKLGYRYRVAVRGVASP